MLKITKNETVSIISHISIDKKSSWFYSTRPRNFIISNNYQIVKTALPILSTNTVFLLREEIYTNIEISFKTFFFNFFLTQTQKTK